MTVTTKPARYRSPSGRYVDWEAIIQRARRQPGVWFLALPAAPASTLITVRKRRAPALRTTPQRLFGELRNTYSDPSGTPSGDLYVRIKET